jgi:hypothetical protein
LSARPALLVPGLNASRQPAARLGMFGPWLRGLVCCAACCAGAWCWPQLTLDARACMHLVWSRVLRHEVCAGQVFNVLFVIGACAFASKEMLTLTAWPLARDCSYYSITLFALAMVYTTGPKSPAVPPRELFTARSSPRAASASALPAPPRFRAWACCDIRNVRLCKGLRFCKGLRCCKGLRGV